MPPQQPNNNRRQNHQISSSERSCPNCQSEDSVGSNPTNYADEYYCWDCELPFNLRRQVCPSCETDESVDKNPMDHPSEFYCYECEMVFDRPGPPFPQEDVESFRLKDGFEAQETDLLLKTDKSENADRTVLEFTLQNIGQSDIVVQGCQPIAIQKKLTDGKWWTVYGNPGGFSPSERIVLAPDETIEWEMVISCKSISGPGFEIQRRFYTGEYRILYWGIPSTESVLATRQLVKFKHW